MTKDLTTGSPAKLILSFALPVLMGAMFQQLYSMVDTMIVGKMLDTSALAAVGSTGSLFFMVIGFVIGVCNGFAIPVAQRMGAGQHDVMRQYVYNAYWLSTGFAVVLTLVTSLLCRDILVAMNTPEDIFDGAYHYILIVFLGIPTSFLYNLLACIIRALGDSKTPVYFLALSSIINVCLDVVFIGFTPMGVAGAALATVISQAISGVACFRHMQKKYDILKASPQEKKPNAVICKTLCCMGLPMGLQYSITAIGNVILQSAVNGLGSMAVGAVTAGQKASFFFWAPFDALGATMATFCGQNVGAMKLKRLETGVKSACTMGSLYALCAYAFIRLFATPLSMLFVNAGEENLDAFLALTKEYLFITNAFLVPLCILNVTRFSIQGMGFSQFAMCAGVMEMIARIAAAQLLVPIYGFTAACYGSPLAWLAALLFLIPACSGCIKKLMHIHQGQWEHLENSDKSQES